MLNKVPWSTFGTHDCETAHHAQGSCEEIHKSQVWRRQHLWNRSGAEVSVTMPLFGRSLSSLPTRMLAVMEALMLRMNNDGWWLGVTTRETATLRHCDIGV
jgi:hypothetical protein